MRYHSILTRIVTVTLQLSLIKSAIFAGGLMFAVLSQAQWQDPLDTPSLKTNRAHESLLLDITRAGSRLVAVGSQGHVVYSDDSGKSWAQANTPSSVTLTAIYFSSSKMGWAVGHDGIILHTDDAGENWVKQFDGYRANSAMVNASRKVKTQAQTDLRIAEVSGEQTEIENAEENLENAIYALEDAEYDQKSGSTKPFLDVWFYDIKTGFAVGAYGMVFHTSDGGKNWIDWSSKLENSNKLHINGITMVGARSLMIAGEQGLILRSDDMGKTWSQMPSPYDGSFFGIMANDDDVLVYGLRGNLYNSVDGGIEWTKIRTKSEQTLMSGIVKFDKSFVLIGNGGSVILLDRQSTHPQSIILPSRTNASALVQAPDSNLVIVGEAGVERLRTNGKAIDEIITSVTAKD